MGVGAYGNLVHRAVEIWAKSRIAGNANRSSGDMVAQAARELGEAPSTSGARRAADAVDMMTSALTDWLPLHAEAPFTLDIDGVTVSGFIDLIVRAHAGVAAVMDYRTGIAPGTGCARRLGLYRAGPRAAWGCQGGGGWVKRRGIWQVKRRLSVATRGLQATYQRRFGDSLSPIRGALAGFAPQWPGLVKAA